jgi:cobalamin biosynthesis protein CobW
VRHLLADAQRSGRRVAVITNEFGELGIDRALLGEGDEAYVELEGGCVCCQLGDAMVETLELLRARVRPERVIVETSGIALPYDTQLHFWREPLVSWISECLGCVVVNAEQLHAGRDLAGTFEDQVTSADLLVLNQVDRVPREALADVERRLRGIEPDAALVQVERGRVEPSLLFPELGQRPRAPSPPTEHEHEQFESSVLEIPEGCEPEALRRELTALGALRVKGFVRTRDGLRLVQGVGPRVELEPVEQAPSGASVGRVVVIRRTAPKAEAG